MPISTTDLMVLKQEAASAAWRLSRRLRLAAHEQDDVRQDILTDLLARLKSFDPQRGTLAAFAGTVVRHRAVRLARRIGRERRFTPISLDDPHPESQGATLAEALPEADGYAALMGQPVDPFGIAERRLDLQRGLSSLRSSDLTLCSVLLESSPTKAASHRGAARATTYRQLREIRLRLMTAGISVAA